MAKAVSIKTKSYARSVFSPAGSLNYIGKDIDDPIATTLIEYNENVIYLHKNPIIADINIENKTSFVNWLEVTGIQKPEDVEKIGQRFGMHPLLIEDVLNSTQKTKIEYFEDSNQYLTILKVPRINEDLDELELEQVSFILGTNFLVSFQEFDNTNVFLPIIERMHRENSKTRKHKANYLLYALIDLVVDNYYLVLGQIDEKINTLEGQILANAKPHHQNQLFFLKRSISVMRKSIFPLKEILNSIMRDSNPLIDGQLRVYFRDVADHVLEIIDGIDTQREDVESLLVNYHSQLSNKMNAVMKTLTVFTAIFMPLSFIAGLYGMNFVNMPELHKENGYFFTLGAMFVLAVTLWAYFKWKKYL